MADVRATEQRSDSSGRSVLVASGPALPTEVLSDRLGLQLEPCDPAFRANIDRLDTAISRSATNNATMRYVAG